MKEVLRPQPLTNDQHSIYPGVRGNIFMAEDQRERVRLPEVTKGGGVSPKRPETPRGVSPEDQRLAKEYWEKFAGGRGLTPEQRWEVEHGILPEAVGGEEATGGPAVGQRRHIFEGLDIELELTEEEKGKMTNEEVLIEEKRRDALRPDLKLIDRADRLGFLDLRQTLENLNNLISRGEVAADLTQPFFDALIMKFRDDKRLMAEHEDRFKPEIYQDIQDAMIIAGLTGRERMKALKEKIDDLSTDLRPIGQDLVRLIAEDEEASAKFLDAIISKPFAAPDAHYDLGFYAGINLQGFFTEVRKIDVKRAEERYKEYIHMRETTIRFHEMNRTIISESGNIEGFTGMTRSFNEKHLQTATNIDGVERMRQLLEIAFGRFYAKEVRVTGANFEPEIINWATRQFEREAKAGEIKSTHFKDVNGDWRNLDEWEIERAVAFGRNIETSFYRFSELITWGNIDPKWEEWLKSLPTETVVRVLAGCKWLLYRFRAERTRGGPQFASLIYDKIEKEYLEKFKKAEEREKRLRKIGTLDIATDVLPTRLFRGGGFDKGWRTLISYLGHPIMRITVPELERFPKEVRGKKIREEVEKFVNQHGGEVTFYKFLIGIEYSGQIITSERERVAGVEVREELREWDQEEQTRLVEQTLLPLLGWRSKDLRKTTAQKYEFNENDFDYDPNADQVNLSLGVLISFGASSDNIKTILWRKAADFLPLRIAYFLSEEGVKRLDGYNNFQGEGGNLFSEEFERKLIKAQRLRFEAQKKTPGQRVDLESGQESYLDQAGLTEEEKQFVRELQKLGRENASKLAKISFPHIPFLEDVPFQNADYLPLGAEVFPRRMGGDFGKFYAANEALSNLTENLGGSFKEKILEPLYQIMKAISTPEGSKEAQDVVEPFFKSYLEMAKQWWWTKFPLVKTIWEFMVKPTSELQKIFQTGAPSDDESQLNLNIRAAAGIGVIRGKKMPGEKKSQADKLMGEVKATWVHVLWREARSAFLLYLLFAAFGLMKRIFKEKD